MRVAYKWRKSLPDSTKSHSFDYTNDIHAKDEGLFAKDEGLLCSSYIRLHKSVSFVHKQGRRSYRGLLAGLLRLLLRLLTRGYSYSQYQFLFWLLCLLCYSLCSCYETGSSWPHTESCKAVLGSINQWGGNQNQPVLVPRHHWAYSMGFIPSSCRDASCLFHYTAEIHHIFLTKQAQVAMIVERISFFISKESFNVKQEELRVLRWAISPTVSNFSFLSAEDASIPTTGLCEETTRRVGTLCL